MKSGFLRRSAYAMLLLAVSISAAAQAKPGSFTGLINDYTPGTTVTPVGPWELRGPWSLTLGEGSGVATFSADLTMVRSDYWVVLNPGEEDLPQDRTPHTHHISFNDGVVTFITGGIQVTGTATITASGSPAGFSPSQLTIQIVGGTSIPYTNVKLTFGSPASGHFGTYSLDGVVLSKPE